GQVSLGAWAQGNVSHRLNWYLTRFPMNPNYYVACDLGAESGRVMLGRWDALRIFEELKTGFRILAQRNLPITSLSVDSWGVDYVLLNRVHPVLWPPFHYRDART